MTILCSIWISWSFIRFVMCLGKVARKLVSPARRWPSRVGGAAAGETSWRWKLTTRRQGGDTKYFFSPNLFPLSTIYEKCVRWRGIIDTPQYHHFHDWSLCQDIVGVGNPRRILQAASASGKCLEASALASSENCLVWAMRLEISIIMNKNWQESASALNLKSAGWSSGQTGTEGKQGGLIVW